MVKEVKWTKYLWLSLLSFGAFMLELLSIFAIEVIFLIHQPAPPSGSQAICQSSFSIYGYSYPL